MSLMGDLKIEGYLKMEGSYYYSYNTGTTAVQYIWGNHLQELRTVLK